MVTATAKEHRTHRSRPVGSGPRATPAETTKAASPNKMGAPSLFTRVPRNAILRSRYAGFTLLRASVLAPWSIRCGPAPSAPSWRFPSASPHSRPLEEERHTRSGMPPRNQPWGVLGEPRCATFLTSILCARAASSATTTPPAPAPPPPPLPAPKRAPRCQRGPPRPLASRCCCRATLGPH